MAKVEYNLVRGMKDIDNDIADRFDFVVKTAKELSNEFNFAYLKTPIVEYANLFDRNLGNESDVVKKELYRFEDKGGDLLALRPEMTAGVCRYVISNGLFQGPFPHKFFSYGEVFRYDRPQKGRYRQFNQLNFEIFGLKNCAKEIYEYLMLAKRILKNIGVKDVVVKINYLGENEERSAYIKALKEYLQGYKEKLSEDSKRRLETNILRILDSKDEGDKEILKNAPKIEDFLTEEHKKYLHYFVERDNKIQIDNNLVRGLDYYTGFVFEIITDKIGETQNAVCGGGEYNRMIEDMSGKQLNAFGFAFGVERLMELMDVSIIPQKAPLYCHLTDKSNFIKNARNEVCYFDDFVKGIKWANQIGGDFVIFEKDNKLFIKDMNSGEQMEFANS